MAKSRKKSKKVAGKVDLRSVYDQCGYSSDYAWFIRTKVIPIIGEKALHSIEFKKNSRVREYSVTQRNLDRVTKSLGVSGIRYNQISKVKKAVNKAGPDRTAELIVKLLETTEQPEITEDFPITFRIPLHSISNNMLHVGPEGKIRRTDRYNAWRKKFFPLMSAVFPQTGHKVDLSKPLTIKLKFGHRKASDKGYKFDLQNLEKAPIDCIFEYFGSDDSMIEDIHTTREFVDSYDSGYIEARIRNT